MNFLEFITGVSVSLNIWNQMQDANCDYEHLRQLFLQLNRLQVDMNFREGVFFNFWSKKEDLAVVQHMISEGFVPNNGSLVFTIKHSSSEIIAYLVDFFKEKSLSTSQVYNRKTPYQHLLGRVNMMENSNRRNDFSLLLAKLN